MQILNPSCADFSVKGKWCLIEVIKLYRRIEVGADIERCIAGEVQRHRCGNAIFAQLSAPLTFSVTSMGPPILASQS